MVVVNWLDVFSFPNLLAKNFHDLLITFHKKKEKKKEKKRKLFL